MLKLLQFIDQLPLEKPEGKLHDWVINVNFLSNNIISNTYSRENIMRMNKMKHERRNVLIFYQIPLTYSLRKCIEISLENLYMDIGMKELSYLSLRLYVDNTSFLVLWDFFHFVKSSGWWKVYSPCLKEWSFWEEKSLVESLSDTGFTNYAK